MQREWKCWGCRKMTTSKSGIEQDAGRSFVTCSQCGARNQLIQVPSLAGSAVQYEVMGLLKK